MITTSTHSEYGKLRPRTICRKLMIVSGQISFYYEEFTNSQITCSDFLYSFLFEMSFCFWRQISQHSFWNRSILFDDSIPQ